MYIFSKVGQNSAYRDGLPREKADHRRRALARNQDFYCQVHSQLFSEGREDSEEM